MEMRRRRGPRARAPGSATRRPLAALAAVAAVFALAAARARAQGDGGGGGAGSGPSTEFRPTAVRFVLKRATTRLPAAAAPDARAASAVTRDQGAGDGDAAPEASGARLSPADERRQERVRAALEAALAGGGGARSAAKAVGDGGTGGEGDGPTTPSLARLRAQVAAAAGVGPSAEALARAATRSSAAAASEGGGGPAAGGGGPATAAAEGVQRSWRALNAFEASDAVGNPQGVSFIPPDAAMAVGGGFVAASVNNAFRAYDSATGAPRSPPVDLTVLFGLQPLTPFAPRPPAGCGDRLVDPTTLWDSELRRWVQVVARIAQAAGDCAPTGKYYVEVAVSATASPLGSWHVYSIDASNDGGAGGSPLVPGCEVEGCFADFPRAQVDPNALVISANSFLGRRGPFVASTVFVVDKFALAKGLQKVALAEFTVATAGAWDDDAPAFSLSPAYVPPRKTGAGASAGRRTDQVAGPAAAADEGGGDDDEGGGDGGSGGEAAAAVATNTAKASTAKAGASPARRGRKVSPRNRRRQKRRSKHRKHKKGGGGGGGGGGGLPAYKEPFLLLSHSLAAEQRLLFWRLDGTRAMRGATTQAGLDALLRDLALTASPVALETPITYPFVLLALQPAAGNFPYGQSLGFRSPGFLGGSDFRVFSSAFADGRLFGVFSTFVFEQAGDPPELVPYFAACLAQIDAATASLVRSDLLGAPSEDATWPSVAVDRRGRGAVVAMVSSETRYASVGVWRIAEGGGGAIGPREVAMEGRGLEDGATQYSGGTPRAGDYGSAVIEAESGDLWATSEYIRDMTCGLDQWTADSTCGGTRAPFSNWDTGVFSLRLA